MIVADFYYITDMKDANLLQELKKHLPLERQVGQKRPQA